MESEIPGGTRKKFLWWGTAALVSITAFRFWGKQKKKEKQTTKMLTRDGHLVEVDKRLVIGGGKKISNRELQQWINDKPAQ